MHKRLDCDTMDIDTDLTILLDGRPVDLPPRVRRIILWLLANKRAITDPSKVQVQFDCSGRAVAVSQRVKLIDELTDCE